jgi:hypothetical protein
MFINRDRQSDEVRAVKDSPPLRGRPGKAAAGVDRLGRATGPSCGSLLLSRLPRPIPANTGCGTGPYP